ncbi:hypothetical protein GOODEAATRI_009277 [Goodea atripinnis]|uniref:Uncharacterized protein n=1 Tax=Goodea atripinnis TaxID=208336 RepID=A0ABV0MSJ1_9TELE
MKKGLILILVGHINFILGAIVHGSVLRHISKPSQHISTNYTVANIISVTSGLLDTTLALWIPCALLSAAEAGLSVWCFIVGLALRGLAPCGNSYIKEQVGFFVYSDGCARGLKLWCVTESLYDSQSYKQVNPTYYSNT